MQRLRCLVRKEFLELRMNPRLFGLVVIAPIVQLTMLGYAATTDVKNVPLLVADGDRSAASRELVARFEASPNFTVVDTVTTVNEIQPYLERGTASLALSIPAGYGTTLRSGGSASCRSSPTARTRIRRPLHLATPPASSAATCRSSLAGERNARRRVSTRAFASGSTLSSRAGTS